MALIIISALVQLGYSPIPFKMILAVSASTAFLTPSETTTDMMIRNRGIIPLNILLKLERDYCYSSL
jgi:di/tricarboxylate transporter